MTALTKAGADVNKVAREALAEASEVLLAEMQARCQSRELKAILAIKVPSGEGDYNYREIGILYDLAHTSKRQAIKARVIEFGSTRMAARPFIRPAIRAKRTQVMNIIRDRLRAAALVD
jgi:HK97 gp10 family phage protein